MITEPCPPPDWDELDAVEPDERELRETTRVVAEERVDYRLVASGDVGAELTPKDATRLLRLCRELDLAESETARVLAAASSPAFTTPAPAANRTTRSGR